MAFVITAPCIDVKDKACVEVCPVDCILGDEEDRVLYIDPSTCIDCGACEPVCPTEAIYSEDLVDEDDAVWAEINRLWFEDKEDARAKVNEIAG